jgi:hypothetical protein
MTGRKEMKGKFVEYDEETGIVHIEKDPKKDPEEAPIVDPLVSYSLEVIRGVRVSAPLSKPPLSSAPEDEYYYFIVPKEQRHQMNIKLKTSVDFDLVEEGSKEVASIRF